MLGLTAGLIAALERSGAYVNQNFRKAVERVGPGLDVERLVSYQGILRQSEHPGHVVPER